jgi:hypothetical protein
MKQTSQTNPDNKPNQTPKRRSFQAQSPSEKTDESGYQGLPLKYRPIAGLCQRDPLDYESHPYPSMKQYAEFLALRINTPRTRHSYYRQMRLVHEHSCNHRACPQCGKQATAEWVERELGKRVGAPYFMVTFTLPEELRALFFNLAAKQVYDVFFAAASSALSDTLANPRWLGAKTSGFTMILHTWNQRLLFHPHLHGIVPGAGIDAQGNVVTVKSAKYLVLQEALMEIFRARLRDKIAALGKELALPQIDDGVWRKEWGVHLKPFGTGESAIKYLGAYVCRTAIGDSRIIGIDGDNVTLHFVPIR